jgi:acyl-coenzyme A synthetase/AMP-(fatty) acid ligase
MLHRYPITSLCAPPTIYRALVSTASLAYLRKNPPLALEHCVGAGEPLNASVIREWREATGITIKDAWGQSETVSSHPRPCSFFGRLIGGGSLQVILVGNFHGEEVRFGDRSLRRAPPLTFLTAAAGSRGEHGQVLAFFCGGCYRTEGRGTGARSRGRTGRANGRWRRPVVDLQG